MKPGMERNQLGPTLVLIIFVFLHTNQFVYRKGSNFQEVQIFVDFVGTSQSMKINFRRTLPHEKENTRYSIPFAR